MIPLESLNPTAAYAVLADRAMHVDMLLGGERLRSRWRDGRIPKVGPEEALPENYVRVDCGDGVQLAVWRDPTRPELADRQAGENKPEPLSAALLEAAGSRSLPDDPAPAQPGGGDSDGGGEDDLDTFLLEAGRMLAFELGLS
jgi:hypothetical protein